MKVAHVATVDLTVRFLLLPQLRALRDAGHDVTAISAPGPWVAEIEANGIRHIAWPHATRAWNPRADAIAFRELVAMFRAERFDVVHTHNPKPGFIGRLAGRALGVPVVLNTVHGLWTTPEDPWRRKAPVLAAEWLAARCSDLELYQSREDLDWSRALHIVRRGRSLHLGNGVDLERFSPSRRDDVGVAKLRAEFDIGEHELVVGTVGRMVREKGYVELFAAARIVREALPNVRFLAVGEADLDKPDAITATQIDEARENVLFPGWRSDVADLMGLMDVFVLPSWREGLPRSAIEAAASGVPLVLTDIRGCREVITHDVEGLLVPVRSPRALSGALLELLRDPVRRRRMGAAARGRAEDRFDERRVADTVVTATARLLSEAGRGGAPAAGTRIRPARASDAVSIARLHREGLPTAFLPTLGDRFLALVYRGLIDDPAGIVLVSEAGGEVAGFAAGVRSVPSFYRRFAIRRGVPAAFAAAPKLVRADVRARLRETVAYPSMGEGLPRAELLAIAVDPRAREAGVGRALAEGVLRGLARRGVRECKVVVGAENDGANRFYERVGFRPARSIEVHAGASSNVWIASCSS